MREGDLEKASRISYGEIPAIQKELAAAEAAADNNDANGTAVAETEPMVPDHVDADSVAGIVSEWTGIPVGRLMQGENEKLLHMEEYLGKRVRKPSQRFRTPCGARVPASPTRIVRPARSCS